MTTALRRRASGPGIRAALALAVATSAWLAAGDAAAASKLLERNLALGFPEPHLRGGSAILESEFHMGGPLTVRRSVVTLTYSNALGVLPDGSSLQLVLNDRPVAKLPLVAAQGAVTARIDIPPTAFALGRNRLALVAEQRHRVTCGREAFDELWTRIDDKQSGLALTLEPHTANLTLAELPGLLASSVYDGEPIVVLSPRDPADGRLRGWGSSAAQALAVMREGRAQSFEVGRLAAPGARGQGSITHTWPTIAGRNVAAIGTTAELAPLIGAADLAGLADGAVAVRPLPADPGHVAVILTGPDDDAVDRAVEAFGSRPRAWPAATRVEARAVARTPAETAFDARWLAGGGSWPLSELGYVSRDLQVGFSGTREVVVDLPPDYYAGDGQRLVLHLNYAYGAGLDATSALHVRVNGAPWNMVRLDRPGGAVVENDRIGLPMGLLRPGRNRIGFAPVLQPASADLCAAGRRPMFSLFDDSRLELAPFARLAVQPDLGAFAASGFPFAHRPSDRVELVIAGDDPATVGAAWTLHGKLAQLHGRPIRAATTDATASSSAAAHLLVVGEVSALPEVLLVAAPVPLGTSDEATRSPSYPTASTGPAHQNTSAVQRPAPLDDRGKWRQMLNDPRTAGEDRGPLDGLLDRLVGGARAAQAGPDSDRTPTAVSSFGPEAAVLAAFESPFAPGRTVTVVAAPDAEGLRKAVDRLIQPPVWDKLEGDFLRWDPAAGEAFAGRAGATFAIDPLPRDPWQLALAGRAFLSRNPAWWIGLLAVLLCGLALVTRATLRAIQDART